MLHLLLEFLKLHVLDTIFLYDVFSTFYETMFGGKQCQNCYMGVIGQVPLTSIYSGSQQF